MAAEKTLEGVFAINKPIGMTSAQVIRDCQTHFNPSTLFKPLVQHQIDQRAHESNAERKKRGRGKRDIRVKMGHGGTLDPLATGVLILGIGQATKTLSQFLGCTKTYETVVLFGASTDTYDRCGRILKKRSYEDITEEKVKQALDQFRGKYRQMPPLYSALKMNGKPLYEYAREGKALPREIETREVEVSELEILDWYAPGEHNHRWPAEEAGSAEQQLAEQVWRLEKQQQDGVKLSPADEKSDIEALAAHEAFKRKAEVAQDELVYEKSDKRRKVEIQRSPLMMSGALGALPTSPGPGRHNGRVQNLVPAPPSPDSLPPWQGKGPPACKIRLTVTSGFYVRTFCHDLGEQLGSAAMMSELLRTRQGDYVLGGARCFDYNDLAKGEKVWGPIMNRILNGKDDSDASETEGYEDKEGPTLSVPSGEQGTVSSTTQVPAGSSISEEQTKGDVEAKAEGDPALVNGDAESSEWNGFPDEPHQRQEARSAV